MKIEQFRFSYGKGYRLAEIQIKLAEIYFQIEI